MSSSAWDSRTRHRNQLFHAQVFNGNALTQGSVEGKPVTVLGMGRDTVTEHGSSRLLLRQRKSLERWDCQVLPVTENAKGPETCVL